MDAQRFQLRLLVSDDKSTTNTLTVLRRRCRSSRTALIPFRRNAVRAPPAGWHPEAYGRIVLLTSADMTYPTERSLISSGT